MRTPEEKFLLGGHQRGEKRRQRENKRRRFPPGKAIAMGVAVFVFLGFLFAPSSWRHSLTTATGIWKWRIRRPLALNGESIGDVVIWSSDLHPSPAHDVRVILASASKTADCILKEKCFAAQCMISNTCVKSEDKDIIHMLRYAVGNILAVEGATCKNDGYRKFWNKFRNDKRIVEADVFLCQHYFGLCQVFMSLGKPMILIASTRYDISQTPDQWKRLNNDLKALAMRPNVVIGGNSLYDVKFIQHYTGLNASSVTLIPSTTLYAEAYWTGTRPEILIGPGRVNVDPYLKQMEAASERQKANFKFAHVKSIYPSYTFDDLAAHRAVVLIPYQVSIMSIFEYYAIGIPLFAPSIDLLKSWHLKTHLLREISWQRWRQKTHVTLNQSTSIPPAPSHANDPDPLAVYSDASLDHWLRFSDFYVWPHVRIYHNFDDLVQQLTDLEKNNGFRLIHAAMKAEFNSRVAASQDQWASILQSVLSSRNRGLEKRAREAPSWEAAMDMLYPELTADTHSPC